MFFWNFAMLGPDCRSRLLATVGSHGSKEVLFGRSIRCSTRAIVLFCLVLTGGMVIGPKAAGLTAKR
jgi:hypothetical protein